MHEPSKVPTWPHESRDTMRLALPLMLSFGGNQILGVVDTLIAGRMGAVSLAAVGIGNVVFLGVTIFGVGLITAVEPLAAQAIGAKRPDRAALSYRSGLLFSILCAAPVMWLVIWVGDASTTGVGIEGETALAVHDYLFMRSFSVLPVLMDSAARSYLQAHRSTSAIVWSMVAANILNVPLSLLLGFGDRTLNAIGLPGVGLGAGLGVAGLGLATCIVSTLRLFILLAPAQRLAAPHRAVKAARSQLALLLTTGWAIGLHWAFEVGVFVTVTVMVGTLGTDVVAGHQIALQLSTFTFCTCLGISGAVGVRVGQAVGRRSIVGVSRAGWSGALLGLGMMSLSACLFLFWPLELIHCFTTDPKVVATALPLFKIVAVFQLSDGLQAVMAGALRGLGDVRAAMLISLVGYWVLGFPFGYWLTFHQGLGASGLWWGLTVGLTFAGLIMTIRFWIVSSRPVATLQAD